MPTLKIGDAAVYYETAGSGDCLVLIPGFASGSWSWKHQTAAFSKDFGVVTFDPRGVSRSTAGAAVTIEAISDDVAALLDHLGVERANILGISFGGFVAQDVAFRYPDRVAKLVLACTSYGGKGHVAPSMEVLTAFASTKGMNSAERIRQYLPMAFSPGFVERSPEVVDEFCSLREQNTVPERVYMDQLVAATTFDFSGRSGGIGAETLVISGDRDTIVPAQNSVNLAAAIPNSRLELVEGGGHMMFAETPELFNSKVIDFLTT